MGSSGRPNSFELATVLVIIDAWITVWLCGVRIAENLAKPSFLLL